MTLIIISIAIQLYAKSKADLITGKYCNRRLSGKVIQSKSSNITH